MAKRVHSSSQLKNYKSLITSYYTKFELDYVSDEKSNEIK